MVPLRREHQMQGLQVKGLNTEKKKPALLCGSFSIVTIEGELAFRSLLHNQGISVPKSKSGSEERSE